jgi:hypothetical protein
VTGSLFNAREKGASAPFLFLGRFLFFRLQFSFATRVSDAFMEQNRTIDFSNSQIEYLLKEAVKAREKKEPR